MLIAGEPHQDRLAVEILDEVEALAAERDIAEYEAVEEVADRRNFGAYGIEQYVALGRTVRQLEADRVRLLDNRGGA